MSYNYEGEKSTLRSDTGQVALLATAFKAKQACASAGVVSMGVLMNCMPGVSDSWGQLAVVDRLVELEYLVEIQQATAPAGQHRIFRWVGP